MFAVFCGHGIFFLEVIHSTHKHTYITRGRTVHWLCMEFQLMGSTKTSEWYHFDTLAISSIKPIQN